VQPLEALEDGPEPLAIVQHGKGGLAWPDAAFANPWNAPDNRACDHNKPSSGPKPPLISCLLLDKLVFDCCTENLETIPDRSLQLHFGAGKHATLPNFCFIFWTLCLSHALVFPYLETPSPSQL
jgi:hypothetical protein